MALPDCFDPQETKALLARMSSLTPESAPLWGKMNAPQMLAHCCILYQQIQGELGGGPAVLRFLARHVLKKSVVGEVPFKKNLPTAKAFEVVDARDFQRERERLGAFIREVHGQGAAAFEGRVHVAYGSLSAREWSNLLWKHLDHHFRQFRV